MSGGMEGRFRGRLGAFVLDVAFSVAASAASARRSLSSGLMAASARRAPSGSPAGAGVILSSRM